MASCSKTIAIAGAGIGGLSTALALARHGINSTIFERRSNPSEAGAGIQLGPNATGILSKLGVLDAVCSVAAEPDALTIHDGGSGRVLARFPLGRWMRERHGAPYLTLHRQDLHRALLSAVEAEPRVKRAYGREVAGFTNSESGADVRFADGTAEAAGALIAADGLWSKLRTEIAGRHELVPTGKTAYRAVVPSLVLPVSLSSGDVHVWMSPGAHVVHYPVRLGSETAIVVVIDGSASSDGWDRQASAAEATQLSVLKFPSALRDVIASANDWRMWRLQVLPPDFRWVNGAAALLGDAAHPMTPFFAQGGALAIEDAAVIARNLARGGAIGQSLTDYENERRGRVCRVFDASVANGRIYHLGGPAAVARNAVLKAVPGALMMRRYDWLYGWTP